MTSSAFSLPDPQQASLAALVLLATCLAVLCHTPPNDISKERRIPDRIGVAAAPSFLLLRRSSIAAIGIYHAIVAFFYPSQLSAICPNPGNLSAHLFTWSSTSALYIMMLLIAAPIRLMAFKQLGPNFTFQLSTPGELTTTGLYGWIQHPSYTAGLFVVFGHTMLCERRGGVAACWLPGWVMESETIELLLSALLVVGVTLACYATTVRVRDEEAMLRETFGEEWEVYHKKTKRFIPYVF